MKQPLKFLLATLAVLAFLALCGVGLFVVAPLPTVTLIRFEDDKQEPGERIAIFRITNPTDRSIVFRGYQGDPEYKLRGREALGWVPLNTGSKLPEEACTWHEIKGHSTYQFPVYPPFECSRFSVGVVLPSSTPAEQMRRQRGDIHSFSDLVRYLLPLPSPSGSDLVEDPLPHAP